jgi:uncharacterized protein (TIGR03118 family)
MSALRKVGMVASVLGATFSVAIGAYAFGMHPHGGYVQTNLVSNDTSEIPANHQDSELINPWGDAFFPGGPFWLNENGSGQSALFNGDGTGFGGANPALAVTIPPPGGASGTSSPTGIVANTSFSFALANSSPALFIFATEDGTISAWNLADGVPGTAELKVDNSMKACANGGPGAVYKGIALGETRSGVFLYAANFRCATVDVFNGSFTQVMPGKFTDPAIPPNYAPFNITNVLGNLFVTYALQDSAKHDDVAGPGHGFVDVFDTSGNLLKHFATRSALNSPWGVALAPFNFGQFSNDILIGNFGDGQINAFATPTGNFAGTLRDPSNRPIQIDGLWSLVFGGGALSDPAQLYFTAGPDGETQGLFGNLVPQ